MNIKSEWEYRLNVVNADIEGIENYLKNPLHDFTINTKDSLRAQLHSKKNYKLLIEKTLKKIGG